MKLYKAGGGGIVEATYEDVIQWLGLTDEMRCDHRLRVTDREAIGTPSESRRCMLLMSEADGTHLRRHVWFDANRVRYEWE